MAGEYKVDMRDIHFNLYDVLDMEGLSQFSKYSELNRELYDMVLEEARKFAVTELAPPNSEWDKIGVKLEDGVVHTPPGLKQVYQNFCEGGWVSPSADIEIGGQGLPLLMNLATSEMFSGANPAFLIYNGLTAAAADLLVHWADEESNALLLPKMLTGEWAGTMCLTEPGAGTAVGDSKTIATPTDREGIYSIEGTKLFISGGDQDFTDNIIHLVLGFTPDRKDQGARGLSLFIVPKVRYDESGNLGEPNDVQCGGVEEKMGIHASATCLLNFGTDGKCEGRIIGSEGDGIKIMFHMMNEARNAVGLQSMATASAAYQASVDYAKERVQGVPWDKMKDPEAPRVEIIEHPDIRRNLMIMKARVEAMRALCYRIAWYQEMATQSDDGDKYQDFVELLTPVVKAHNSDTCFDVCVTGMQVLGGYGYCGEYPLEQYARDAKIYSIYEGANGIQALDLIGRKLTMKSGMMFMTFMGEVTELIGAAKEVPGLADEVKLVEEAQQKLVETTMTLGQKGMMGDRLTPVLNATPYLAMFGDVVFAVLLLHQAALAQGKLEEQADGGDIDELCEKSEQARFLYNKVASAKFFAHELLPRIHGLAMSINDGHKTALEAKL